jgi:ribosomal protein L29
MEHRQKTVADIKSGLVELREKTAQMRASANPDRSN